MMSQIPSGHHQCSQGQSQRINIVTFAWSASQTANGRQMGNVSVRQLPVPFFAPWPEPLGIETANPPQRAQQDHPIAMLMFCLSPASANVTKVSQSPNRVITTPVLLLL